jgi:hypothetical protein
MADTFSYKIPTESALFTFDFSQVLEPTETISTAVCTIIVMSGVDANADDMIVNAAIIDGQTAMQRIEGGVSEVSYRLVMTVTTSESNTYVGVGDISVYGAELV